MSQGIDAALLDQCRKSFQSDPRHRMALNAVTKTTVKSVALNRQSVTRINHAYSHTVKSLAATSQNKSGRCWLFAGLNLFRAHASGLMNLENFEFSQNYPMFFDKFEKSNYFLESILATLDEPTDGRLIWHLLRDPIQDGGQWDMFCNIIDKYGVVPREVMPETESSSNTGLLVERITLKLREFASQLRAAHVAGASTKSLSATKQGMLNDIYRMLCIHLGEPPTSFEWQWQDKDKAFHRDAEMTPAQFRDKYLPEGWEDRVCLIHCPQSSKQFGALYTIQYLGNVVGGRIIRYLNVEMHVMKQAAAEMIRDGKPVWFGCDVGKHLERELGLMDLEIHDYDALYSTKFGMDKPTRLDYGSSEMTHAMVLTGVDIDEHGRTRKWRVENSWGDKDGDKGYFLMTDDWFSEYNYEVVVDSRYVPDELLAALKTAPIPLPPWDPMGALATA